MSDFPASDSQAETESIPSEGAVLELALPVPLDRCFDYWADAPVPQRGDCVEVEFAGRRQRAVILRVKSQSEFAGDLKPVLARLPWSLSAATLALAQFVARYYHAALGEVLAWCWPPLPQRAWVPPLQLVLAPAQEPWLQAQLGTRKRTLRPLLQALQQCHEQGQAMPSAGFLAQPATQHWLRAACLAGCIQAAPPAPMRALDLQKMRPTALPLHEAQAQAVTALQQQLGQYHVALLHGVTGSGKTEVYLHLAQTALACGMQVLILVPEINLTPQLQARFAARLGAEQVGVMHSGLADGERYRLWVRAARAELPVLVGTRLAVFVPMPRLGLIVVDEEHDASFKQQEGVRFQARDLAVWRGQQEQALVLLGSATPSLETYRHALQGRYALHRLPQRARSQNPTHWQCLDTRRERLQEGLSATALQAMRTVLARGDQVLVFVNRRGYAPVLRCEACGWMADCGHCSSHLVWHQTTRRLHCHHCGAQQAPHRACPCCGNPDLRPQGVGTQRLEETLRGLFPDVALERIDRDTTAVSAADWHHRAQHRGARILIGTQMLAKGHDWEGMALAVLVQVDASLFSQDFRALERSYALLSQVGGRVGRHGEQAQVLIHTAYPELPLFRYLLQQDYHGFALAELAERERLGLPPARAQALLRVEGRQLPWLLDSLTQLKQRMAQQETGVHVADPIPAQLEKKAGKYRAYMLMESESRRDLAWALHKLKQEIAALQKMPRWRIDVDPIDF